MPLVVTPNSTKSCVVAVMLLVCRRNVSARNKTPINYMNLPTGDRRDFREWCDDRVDILVVKKNE